MDINLLKDTLIEHFNDTVVNQYDSHMDSVPEIAKEAIKKFDDMKYEMASPSKIVFYYRGREVGGFNGQNIMTNKKEGTRIARDKYKTEQYLMEKKVATTKSFIYDANQFEEAKKELEKHTMPFVIKPYNLSSGKGVVMNVNPENVSEAWLNCLKAYEGSTDGAQVIIQPQLPGIEARFLVINEHFSSAILRVPANITGDGNSTIRELIKCKNHLRKQNPHLKKFMIPLNLQLESYLTDIDLNLDSVVQKNRVIFFTSVSNVALGGDTLEISHLVSDNLKRLAESAVEAVPHLKSAGVDIMFSRFNDEEAKVLELNHAANLVMHYYPWKGTPKQPIHDYINDIYEEAQREKKSFGRLKKFIRKRLNN
ncbi:ATP-grasp domain-containing protein [Salinicoccus halitifaciens]|uniref:D-alanine-D-alanine ligase-like ATP-grasp enzyme n=1 Tax=Salinicoccus halitifaciens TaxID=1073415 RepID=A0ABV2EC22_9STAP|nr:ATP-grasp domain-containing protein [Salinicoccus halitifaciens]MCD2137387.1 ATP-grasp domain-containing protein [Salinicoccus halitifaciens]